VVWVAPRALEDIVRPRRLAGVGARPLNFTVRGHSVPHVPLVVSCISAAALSACGTPDQTTITERAQSDSVQVVKSDDPEMLRAFAKAKETLDEFLARLAAKDPALAMPALKVRIQDGDAVEYFWVTSPSVSGQVFSGTIDNEPETVRNVHNGQVISFQKSQIYDWTYHDPDGRKTFGNFTACALLTHEPPASAAEFKKTYGLNCDP
jgi:uncharacterized protein YegJ (DUF2314 family)